MNTLLYASIALALALISIAISVNRSKSNIDCSNINCSDKTFSQKPTNYAEFIEVIECQKPLLGMKASAIISSDLSNMKNLQDYVYSFTENHKSEMTIEEYELAKKECTHVFEEQLTDFVKSYNSIPEDGIEQFVFTLRFMNNVFGEGVAYMKRMEKELM